MGLCLSTAKNEPQNLIEGALKTRTMSHEASPATSENSELFTSSYAELSQQYLEQGLSIKKDDPNYTEKKIEAYTQALHFNPNNLRAKFSLASVKNSAEKKQTGQSEGYISTHFWTVIQEISNSSAITSDDYIAKSFAFEDLKQPLEQAAMRVEALKLKPTAAGYSELGKLYKDLKQWEKAEAAYKTGIELSKDNIDSNDLWNYALVLGELKKFDEAIEVSNRAIKLTPNNSGLYGNLGTYFGAKARKTGDKSFYDEAIKNYEKALSFDQQDSVYLCNYGRALYQRDNPGDKTKALEYFNKAFEAYKNPENCKDFDEALHAGLQLTFSVERAYLLENLTALTETEVQVIAGGESSASTKEVAEHNKNAAKLTHEKAELAVKAAETLGPQSHASSKEVTQINADMKHLMEQMALMNENYKKLTEENASLKKAIDSKAEISQVSYAIRMNFQQEDTAAKMAKINADTNIHAGGKHEYFDGFCFTMNNVYTTYSVSISKVAQFDLNNSNIAVTALSVAANALPFGGNAASSVIKGSYDAIKTAETKRDAAKFTKIASDSVECSQVVMHLAMKITLHPGKEKEIEYCGNHKQDEGAWAWCVTKLHELGDFYQKFMEGGDRYSTPASKLGCKDALILIKDIVGGKIFMPPEQNFEDLCLKMLGLEGACAEE